MSASLLSRWHVVQGVLEQVWKALHAFGYRLEAPAAGSAAAAPRLPALGAPGGSPSSAAHAAGSASSSAASAGSLRDHREIGGDAWPDALAVVLTTPPTYVDGTLPIPDACWTVPSSESPLPYGGALMPSSCGGFATSGFHWNCAGPSHPGFAFLRSLFELHAEAIDGAMAGGGERILSAAAINDLFAATPTGVHPFGPVSRLAHALPLPSLSSPSPLPSFHPPSRSPTDVP